MKDENRILALWLVPAPTAREFFHSLIAGLAQRFDAPAFEPHLTLFGTAFDDAVDFHSLDAVPLPDFIELEVDGIEFSDRFTKTLFVRFERTAELMDLKDVVSRSLGDQNRDELDPHLSLLYRTMPNEQKAELARTITLPFDRVRFDSMKAIRTPATIESRAGVEAWQTLWGKSFQP